MPDAPTNRTINALPVAWILCDLCGDRFKQPATTGPLRHTICPGCLTIQQQQEAVDAYLHGMRG